jgi:hypothetical protein
MSVFELVGQETSEGKDPRGRQVWRIHDVTTATTARGVAWAAAPVVFDGLLKQDAQVKELGNDQWDVDVTYGKTGSGDEADISWSFDIGTSQLHITQALEHVESFVASGDPPDHKGAIGVVEDGFGGKKNEGCDVIIPVFTWEETHNLLPTLVASYAWIRAMELMVAHINFTRFRVWEKGELLLLGISGQHASLYEKRVPVTYKFASSRTKTGMTIGDIKSIDKEGHNYLWIEYERKEDTDSDTLTNRPLAVHVERVYDYAEFSGLGIGDPWS